MAHTSLAILSDRLKKANELVEVGKIYVHYRDPSKKYQVISIGLNEADEEPHVIYKALYNPDMIWIRPVSVWIETVEHEGKFVTRFQKL